MCWINIIKDTNINKVFYAMVRFSQVDIKKFKGRVITYRLGWGNRQIMISLDILLASNTLAPDTAFTQYVFEG